MALVLRMRKNPKYNCVQNLISAVAEYYKCDYQLVFLESWGFDYKKVKIKIGDNIHIIWGGNLDYRNELLNCHGINMEFGKVIKDINNIEEYVNENLLAFYIDSYDCYWLPSFKKQHRKHVCNLARVEKDMCLCQDEYSKENIFYSIPLSSIKSNNILLFTLNSEKSHESRKMICKHLRFISDRFQKYECEKSLWECAEDFANYKQNIEMQDYDDIVESTLLMKLNILAEDRYKMKLGIEYINQKLNISLIEPIDMLTTLSQKYSNLRAYLMKCYFMRKEPDNKKIYIEFESIINLESKVQKHIQLFLNNI